MRFISSKFVIYSSRWPLQITLKCKGGEGRGGGDTHSGLVGLADLHDTYLGRYLQPRSFTAVFVSSPVVISIFRRRQPVLPFIKKKKKNNQSGGRDW